MSFSAVARLVPGTLRTTTGTQDVISRGIGTPKGFVIVVSWATALSDSTFRAGGGAAQGFSDGTRHRCMWYGAIDDSGTQISGSGGSPSKVIRMVSPQTGSQVLAITFDSWITDGVRLSVDSTNGDAFQFYVILLAGEDVEAYAFQRLANASGAKVTTGFSTSFVLTNQMKTTDESTSGEGRWDPGIASRTNPSNGVCCIRIASDTAASTAEGRRGKYSNQLTQYLGLNEGIGGADIFGGAVTIDNYVSDGFDVSCSSAAAVRICGLAVKWPINMALDVDEVNPVSTGSQSKTFPTFRTRFVYAVTSACTSDNSLQNGAGGGCGAGDFINQRALVLHDQNNVTTTNAGSRMSESVIDAHNGSADTHLLSADLLAQLSTGFSLDWTVVDATDPRHYAILALASDPYDASFSVSFGSLSGSFTGRTVHSATFSTELSALVVDSFAAQLVFSASLSTELPALTGSLAAQLRFSSAFDVELPAFVSAFMARLALSASFEAELAALVGAFTSSIKFKASFDLPFAALEGSTVAALAFRGNFDQELPSLTGSFVGMVAIVTPTFSAVFVVELPALAGLFYAYAFGASAQICFEGAYEVLDLAGEAGVIELAGSYNPRLEFAGSGATIELAGSYDLRTELQGERETC